MKAYKHKNAFMSIIPNPDPEILPDPLRWPPKIGPEVKR